ncbi:phospholipase [Microbacterium sp. 4R-513]|uniref:aggregation-promoting factor C-terminal-like domain-containing protein n=1 Tax=Microbacterium sp. 4R-513 TaxID=2567934 RepID=UPI0013E1436D|nr:phospholipase [Microbacterium sp. 4R-513]QIG39663.1 phospholipase [Microbacterium sp. 4R-513]
MLADRRALRAARPRRHLSTSALIAGAVIGAVAITGLTAAASASAYADPGAGSSLADVVAATTPAAVASSRAESIHEISTDAKTTLVAARTAVTEASLVATDIAASGLDVGAETSVDTSMLTDHIAELSSMRVLPLLLLPGIAEDTAAETAKVAAQTATLRTNLEAAQEKKAAEEAAAAAAAAAAAEAQRQAEAAAAAAASQAAANTPEGAQAAARQIAASEYGWGDGQFSCLVSLWDRESDWNYQAYNSGSGATGIPQSLPGSKMASAGADWQTNATTQIRWGLGYIAGSYGSPCAAWGHSNATGWY